MFHYVVELGDWGERQKADWNIPDDVGASGQPAVENCVRLGGAPQMHHIPLHTGKTSVREQISEAHCEGIELSSDCSLPKSFVSQMRTETRAIHGDSWIGHPRPDMDLTETKESKLPIAIRHPCLGLIIA